MGYTFIYLIAEKLFTIVIFSTILSSKNEIISCLAKQIDLRSAYLSNKSLGTIYPGGGTRSILSSSDLRKLLEKIKKYFDLSALQEFTIKINPDDISKDNLEAGPPYSKEATNHYPFLSIKKNENEKKS
jgi:coproporphyrinogen III oxidase-like Fe-S oxidoreductase